MTNKVSKEELFNSFSRCYSNFKVKDVPYLAYWRFFTEEFGSVILQ